MSKVIDVFSYNGEADILEIRLNVLDKYVDQFIVVECPTTFCGHAKPMYFREQMARFKPFLPKIKYFIVDEKYTTEEMKEAMTSPYTNGNERWALEYLQKESLKKAMTHLDDDDICYIGDVDEIWEHREPKGLEKLKLRVYTYYLNMLSTEEFWGPVRGRYRDMKDKCFNEIRNDKTIRTEDYQGLHYTNQGGLKAVKKKIIDQYNPELFNSKLIIEDLDVRFGQEDMLGRDFVLTVDETHLPDYVKLNRDKYKHLLK